MSPKDKTAYMEFFNPDNLEITKLFLDTFNFDELDFLSFIVIDDFTKVTSKLIYKLKEDVKFDVVINPDKITDVKHAIQLSNSIKLDDSFTVYLQNITFPKLPEIVNRSYRLYNHVCGALLYKALITLVVRPEYEVEDTVAIVDWIRTRIHRGGFHRVTGRHIGDYITINLSGKRISGQLANASVSVTTSKKFTEPQYNEKWGIKVLTTLYGHTRLSIITIPGFVEKAEEWIEVKPFVKSVEKRIEASIKEFTGNDETFGFKMEVTNDSFEELINKGIKNVG